MGGKWWQALQRFRLQHHQMAGPSQCLQCAGFTRQIAVQIGAGEHDGQRTARMRSVKALNAWRRTPGVQRDQHVERFLGRVGDAARLETQPCQPVLFRERVALLDEARPQLDADDRIVQLSTCRSALTSDPVRYIVTAVLVGEKPAA